MTLDAVGVEGTWSGYSFTPKTSGTFTVIATYNNLVAYQQNVVSGKVARLSPTNASIKLNKAGETATIAMNAYDQDGFSYWASTSTNYSVADESVGTVSGNHFTAKKEGSTYIKCEKDGAIAYITVTVGNAAAVKAPAAAAAKDALNQTVTVANDGAHYFNVAGKLAYTGTNKIDAAVYTSAREKAKAYVDAKRKRGNLRRQKRFADGKQGGFSDMERELSFPEQGWRECGNAFCGKGRHYRNKPLSVGKLHKRH